MRISTKAGLSAATMAIAAGAVAAGTLGGGAQAAPAAGGDKVVDATVAQANVAGRGGWQGAYTYALPAGSGGVFFHYPCPTGFVARSGAFDVNGAGQAGVKLVGQGPRWDQSYKEWFTTLTWAGGAPAGVTITYDVYCTKTPA